jgi:RHH-type transcriptional regulator, proline utilization regulon repressor / proline dehydrogenase / delta 1-pyrroline-5-carboxylate dehydrogenase
MLMEDFTFINKWYRASEVTVIEALLAELNLDDSFYDDVHKQTLQLITRIRSLPKQGSFVAKLMHQFKLSSPQGLTLMAMAESLLRIPDTETQDKLISEKLAEGDWGKAFQDADESLMGLSKFALLASQKILHEDQSSGVSGFFRKALAKTGAPVIRQSVKQMIGQLADEFILGSSIDVALQNAKTLEDKGYRYSYDMLGEAAMTARDAERYLNSYKHAIHALARVSQGQDTNQSPSISVKLSALHPRFEYAQKHRVLEELTPKVIELAQLCRESQIAMTIDAEEADVLELTLHVLQQVATSPSLKGWDGFGIVIQAYQKRAYRVVDWAIELAKASGQKINVRLVKGAYWDTEIKRAQERGLSNYPVFTHKFHTDLSYLACAKKLLENRNIVYPQFATHNAYTAVSIMTLAGNRDGYEFQRLHGMGEELYQCLLEKGTELQPACRIYAPVGAYDDLLPYLVRRILENGANTSFVHHLTDPKVTPEQLAKNPVRSVKMNEGRPHPKIPLPSHLYGLFRKNSHGLDLSDDFQLQTLYEELELNRRWQAAPVIGGDIIHNGEPTRVLNPADHGDHVGDVSLAKAEDVKRAYDISEKAFEDWTRTPAEKRAECLDKLAELMEDNYPKLMALCIREGGKTIPDAIAEVREAVDFCRYYALKAREDFGRPMILHGPTGEHNQLSLHGRGVFACISPWNFPLAIFTGQVTAALAAGNCVIAKPAGPTPLIAAYAIQLMHEAGIPKDVLHFVPGASSEISEALLADPRIGGVALTGSVDTAHHIQNILARSEGPIVPIIAETGGQNAMIVDSSALPEQVVTDVITSAFQSAGQRCSALRILFLQEDIADKTLEMLVGAMKELRMGNPGRLITDIGPVVNADAKKALEEHIQFMTKNAKKLYQVQPSTECDNGSFVAPAAFELSDLSLLQGEKFGPILHVLRYKASELDRVIDQVNAMGFGLTLGIHSRIEKTYRHVFERMRVGNTYVNRSMIGAVVGVQPFGGEGLSGTGPKAGSPRYLHRFATERSLSINTTAQGGNATLMTLTDEF